MVTGYNYETCASTSFSGIIILGTYKGTHFWGTFTKPITQTTETLISYRLYYYFSPPWMFTTRNCNTQNILLLHKPNIFSGLMLTWFFAFFIIFFENNPTLSFIDLNYRSDSLFSSYVAFPFNLMFWSKLRHVNDLLLCGNWTHNLKVLWVLIV